MQICCVVFVTYCIYIRTYVCDIFVVYSTLILFCPTVPDAVSDVDVFPFGVQCIGINWTNAMDLKIRHSGSLVFFVVVTEISSNITFMINNGEQNSISFNSTYLMPEEEYKFKVTNCLYAIYM